MKKELVEELKTLMISNYRSFGNGVVLVKGTVSYTGEDIAFHIENETSFGIKTMNGVIQLSIDLVKRKKVEL